MTAPGRALPGGLADIVGELELRQPTVVSISEIAELAKQAGLKTPAAIIADRLRQRGWLLKTGQRGVYEFAPGSHAGPWGHGDPFVSLRAARVDSDFPAALALQSALWLHQLSDRAPNVHELAVPSRVPVPKALEREMRIVRYSGKLELDTIDGLPVHRAATILVQLAASPSSVRGWPTFGDALSELVSLSREPVKPGAGSSARRLTPPRASTGRKDQQLKTELAGRGVASTDSAGLCRERRGSGSGAWAIALSRNQRCLLWAASCHQKIQFSIQRGGHALTF